MPIEFDTLSALLNHGFDTLIDVRTPAEFAEDHIPGAVNLPALTNQQRVEVGTIYKRVSAFNGRKIGAAMVARNVADHIEGPLSPHDGSWRPLVYCWRGGQRSGSVAVILSQIGWRADTIKGGYQTFRKLVHSALYLAPVLHRFILLDGNTGTAKTAILGRLRERGVQVIDLEGMAGHRGSLLGATATGQPSQKAFETKLAVALCALDPTRPVIVEAESSKIGRIVIPPQVWSVMSSAPRIVITAPIAARAEFLTNAYADIIAHPDALRDRLDPLRKLRGHAIVDAWNELIAQGAFNALATALMEQHYDAAYSASRNISEREILATVHAKTLGDDGQSQATEAIISAIKQQ